MKKIFTLSLALVAVATAFASNPNVKVVNESTEAMSVKVDKKALAVESKCADVKVLRNDIAPVNAPAAAGDENVTLQYAYPAGTMFNYLFFSSNGEPGYWSSAPTYCTVPALDDITFRNNSYFVVGTEPKRANEGYEYTWTFKFDSGDKTETSDYNLEWPTTPAFYYNYGINTPILSMGGNEEFQLGYTIERNGEETLYPNFVVTGGGNYVSDDDKQYYEDNNGWTDMEVKYKLYNASYKGAESYYTSNVFNIGDRPAAGVTMASINDAWAELMVNDETDITDVKLVGMGQVFPDPGQAWSISSIDMTVYGNIDAGATFDVCFYTLGANNTPDQLIKKFTYTVEEKVGSLAKAEPLSFEIPFTTVDEIGDELGYQIIEGGMVMMFEGLADNAKIHAFAPPVGAYPHKKGIINNLSEYNLYGLVQYKEDGVEKTSMVANLYMFGTSEEDDSWTWPVTFNFEMVAEYPYMIPMEVISAGAEEWAEVESEADDITVELKNADDYSVFQVYCSGTVEDLSMYRVGEDTEIPEWLSVGIEDANDYFNNLTGEARAYVIQFALTDGAQPGGCEVAIEYKGIKNVYKINPDLSGIEGVVDNGVETVASEYYDLQGRKLYNEPANGLFIRKDIKADGSVKSVKVVK